MAGKPDRKPRARGDDASTKPAKARSRSSHQRRDDDEQRERGPKSSGSRGGRHRQGDRDAKPPRHNRKEQGAGGDSHADPEAATPAPSASGASDRERSTRPRRHNAARDRRSTDDIDGDRSRRTEVSIRGVPEASGRAGLQRALEAAGVRSRGLSKPSPLYECVIVLDAAEFAKISDIAALLISNQQVRFPTHLLPFCAFQHSGIRSLEFT